MEGFFPWSIFPQIAGSYMGSYFSKIGLLIPKIPAAATYLPSFVSLRDLYFGLLLAAPAFTCLPSFVPLCDLHSGLLLAAPAFICLPSFVSLCDLDSGLLFLCFPLWSPFWPALGCSCLHLSPFLCLPLWSPFWPALRCPCLHLSPFIRLPAWSPFWPALGCSCLNLSPFICLPARSPFLPALGGSCLHSGLRLPAFICLPAFWSALGCSCLFPFWSLKKYICGIMPTPPHKPKTMMCGSHKSFLAKISWNNIVEVGTGEVWKAMRVLAL